MKNLFRNLYRNMLDRLPAEQALAIQYFRYNLKFLNLKNPKTFGEKIQRRKIAASRPLDPVLIELADKVRVKDYVARKCGQNIIIPTLWHGKTLPPLAERNWPVPFIIKANNASAWNVFVKSEADLDWNVLEKKCEEFIHEDMPLYLWERWYNAMEKQLLIEPFLLDPEQGEALWDYKIFVFHGKVHFIQVHTGRRTKHRQAFFDTNWTLQPFWLQHSPETRPIEKPAHLKEMIEIAETLGAPFDFVRIDLYDLPDGPRFGEITFTRGAGFEKFVPAKYDRILGDLW